MLGEIIYEETGKTIGLRVLSSEGGEVKVEVTLQAQGKIAGIDHTSLWTYWSKTRSDGSIHGEGKGVITTKDGDVINLTGSGSAMAPGPGGTINYRGAIHFHTTAERFRKLNGIAGVHEYDVEAEGNTTGKIWEWK